MGALPAGDDKGEAFSVSLRPPSPASGLSGLRALSDSERSLLCSTGKGRYFPVFADTGKARFSCSEGGTMAGCRSVEEEGDMSSPARSR